VFLGVLCCMILNCSVEWITVNNIVFLSIFMLCDIELLLYYSTNIDSVIAFRFNIENIDRIANTASDVYNRVTMLNELLQCRDGMLCLSDSFSSNDVEQLISFLCTSLWHYSTFILILFFFPFLSLFWMLMDTIFARDMYQVYEINDDWLKKFFKYSNLCDQPQKVGGNILCRCLVNYYLSRIVESCKKISFVIHSNNNDARIKTMNWIKFLFTVFFSVTLLC